MKKLLFPALALLSAFAISNAQAPQQLNYQAVVRNTSGQPVASGTPVNLRFTIHDSTATGTQVYQQVISDTANQFGLVNVQIGAGNNLSSVGWGTGPKYLQVEVEVNNASSY